MEIYIFGYQGTQAVLAATMSLADELPPSLNLPPHLSAHKYFMVCTLTVMSWDTLVLSPRAYRLFKSPGWPALKILFHWLRFFMLAEFIIVCQSLLSCSQEKKHGLTYFIAVAFFDTRWTQSVSFYLQSQLKRPDILAAMSPFLPLRTHMHRDPTCCYIWCAHSTHSHVAPYQPASPAIHVIRIHAIYDKSRPVLITMSSLFAVQIVVTAICCGFYFCTSRSLRMPYSFTHFSHSRPT